METPILSHITLRDYECVYEPAEDSFLMLDALELEIENIKELNPAICLEIGSGSGINITAFAHIFDSCFCFCVDINMRACEVSLATGKANKTNIECINMDLASCIRTNLIDVLIFNPPYVVTDSLEMNTNHISKAWAGGIHGREIIDRFLLYLPGILSEKGVCYMIVIEENRPHEIEAMMKTLGYKTTSVVKRKAWNERLQVLKFSKA